MSNWSGRIHSDEEWQDIIEENMRACRLCPRECGVDRLAGRVGVCRSGAVIRAARAALHFWEEPVISGTNGSGAVFFSGCPLGCIFCQNAEISEGADRVQISAENVAVDRTEDADKTAAGRVGVADRGADCSCRESGAVVYRTGKKELPGKDITPQRLADIFLRLQEKEHANNINLVTATHYTPQVAYALDMARERGLTIPVVYNTSGYEKVESLRLLDGLVDVYLPDFKYMDSEISKLYSHAADYPERVKDALAEMVRQAGEPAFIPERRVPVPTETLESPGFDAAQTKQQSVGRQGIEEGSPGGREKEPAKAVDVKNTPAYSREEAAEVITRGVIVRHLLLPGHVKDSEKVVKYLYKTYGNDIYISIMNQYTPMDAMKGDPLLGRRVTRHEYMRLVDFAIDLGVENGFIQEGGSAKESFIPSFDGEGV